MKLSDLKKSEVVFREEDHTYWLGDKQLFGITKMIERQLFPDKYKNVPKASLDNRANIGTAFHKAMEAWIVMGLEQDNEMFKVFKENYGDIKFIASEYLVSDNETFASKIDGIDENEILWDWKSSTKKNIEYWRWQMSVYRVMYTLQNGREPKGYKVLWINKDLKHEIVDILPYDMNIVKDLMNAEREGRQFVYEKPKDIVSLNVCEELAVIENTIISFQTKIDELEEKKSIIKDTILKAMQNNNIKSWETDRLKFTVKDAYVKNNVDGKTLKEKYPNIYKEVVKTSSVKASLLINIKEAS